MSCDSRPVMLLLSAATLLVSAALLFIVEPMFAKMVLPLLGGTPAVWNTCVVFFQATMLLAYLYVHVSTSRLPPRNQAVLHAVIVLVPFAVLPITVDHGWVPTGGAAPIPWLIGLMVLAVGLPFFVVATTAPLVQRWFSVSGHRHARDPYFLYAASNVGSLVGLLSYPIALEPGLRLSDQSWYWTLAYGALVVLILGCMAAVWRQLAGLKSSPALRTSGEDHWQLASGRVSAGIEAQTRPYAGTPELPSGGVTIARRTRWVLLALVPSSLMLGVTTYLSVDIAAVPLLWVVPLTIYLLTFVLAFSTRPWISQAVLRRLLPILALTLLALILRDATQPSWLVVPLHLIVFFVAAQVCHGELAGDRPSASGLTGFYLWISVGGVLGGLFNSIIAPLMFTGVVEYPLALIAACALLPPRVTASRAVSGSAVSGRSPLDVGRGKQGPTVPALADVTSSIRRDLIAAAAVGALTVVLVQIARRVDPSHGPISFVLMLGVPALVAFRFVARPRRFAMALATILVACVAGPDRFGSVLHAERSFYGVHRVTTDPSGRFRVLLHGHTIHGRQSLDPSRRKEPLTYFHRTGPIGQVFAARQPELAAGSEVAVIGLGSGSLIAYAHPDQHWTFYEIDPAVDRIARDPAYFTFLSDAQAPWRIVLGDARLSLREAAPQRYSVLVLDAFSSDAIPVHLLTREALDLYLSKLRPDGLLAFHISNNYLRLRPVLAALARDTGLAGRAQFDVRINAEEARGGKTASEWVVMARAEAGLGALGDDPRWATLTADQTPVWRDDFSNILRVFKW